MTKKTIALLILILGIAMSGVSNAQPAKVGTTFSQVQCEYLGLDWKETYDEILEMEFDFLRLGAYWYRIESVEQEYNYEELDWQLDRAKKKNIPVILTVGMKAPRWPEYFIPAWLLQRLHLKSQRNITDNDLLREKTLGFIQAVVNRYKDHDIIYAWQVENEPLNMAGPKNWWLGKDFLEQEIALVRQLDGHKRPIMLNAMTYANSTLQFLNRMVYSKDPIKEIIGLADIPAINIYPSIGHKFFNMRMCFKSNPKGRMRYYSRYTQLAEAAKKELWITELQAEPWEPGQLVHVRNDLAITCGVNDILNAHEEITRLGINTIFLWGAEYWIFRKVKFDDPSWLDAAKHVMDAIHQ